MNRNSLKVSMTGICASLFIEILCFRYTAIPTVDGKYGSRSKKSGEWNGMIGMVVRKVGKRGTLILNITDSRAMGYGTSIFKKMGPSFEI